MAYRNAPPDHPSLSNMSEIPEIRSGYVALVGRPNVGKSTLMNRILGQKIAITTPKPQTTRHRILGIHTTEDTQIVFVDTPGLHRNAGKAMNRHMNRVASAAIGEVDVVAFLVDGLTWTEEDEAVLQRLQRGSPPVVLVVNKVDRIDDKNRILPHLQRLSAHMDFTEVVPLSALKGDNVDALEKALSPHLPHRDRFYPEDQITDRSERFLAAELIREKLMLALEQELPYALSVEIESFKREEGRLHVIAMIFVEREGQKRIVIGKGGKNLKRIGQAARLEMNRIFEEKTHLELWVKVRSGWSDDERALRSLGYES